MTVLDDRLATLSAEAAFGHRRVVELRLRPSTLLTSTDLRVITTTGFAVLDHKVAQFAAAEHDAALGATLSDNSEVWAALVYYYHPDTDKIRVRVVKGEEALSTEGAAQVTDAEIVAALNLAEPAYTLAGQTRFARSGSTITQVIDGVAASFEVLPDRKYTSDGAAGGEQPGQGSDPAYEFAGLLEVTVDADDWADGDFLTDVTLGFRGRILAIQAITEKDIAGAGATTSVHAEIGATPTTGGVVVAALGDTLGVVKAGTAITGANTFEAGDTVSLVAASSTAGTGGRSKFQAVLERAL